MRQILYSLYFESFGEGADGVIAGLLTWIVTLGLLGRVQQIIF